VRGFWATSYSFDLKLFDQYLLRRLAQRQLNATVLVDHDKLASAWEHVREGETYLARQAGRRYLLRGVRLPGGGAFHPKTYLFAHADEATLLVGSGNLTRPGIDHGYEAFTTFTTQRDEDLPSMRAWAQWTGKLVQMLDDQLVSDRWTALRESCRWILGPAGGSQFLTNDERPLADQLIERLPSRVAELHVTAPFFDPDAVIIQRLLAACSPQRLALYVGKDVSVRGPSLETALRGAAEVRVRRFEPSTFVHAKLIGAVGADGTGVLLSGSPNLSLAALARTHAEPHGNCEAAVIRSGTGKQVRDVFEGSGLDLIDEPLDWVTNLRFRDDHPSFSRPIVLRSACWRDDGRIQLALTAEVLPNDMRLSWEGPMTAAVTAEGVTVEPLNAHDPLPLIVSLVDGVLEPVSNWVVVDDPVALHEALVGSSDKSSNRPREMEGVEMSQLVRLVLWAHDKLIFDPDETAAFRRAQEAVGEDQTAEDVSDFWELYAHQELQYDPRTQSYKPLTVSGDTALPVDELLRELQMLLHAAPSAHPARVLRLLALDQGTEGQSGVPGTPWSLEARQRIRAYHLLTRWATAVSDPRHALVAPLAPVVNYEALLGIVFLAWANDALEATQLRRLLLTLLDAFIGDAPGHGFLGRVNDEQRSAAVAALDAGFVEIAAGLVYVVLAESAWQKDIYAWQPILQRGVELGVILPGALSASVVLHLTGKTVEENAIDEVLAHRLDWVDDATWCKRLAGELDLPSVLLEPFNHPHVRVLARVSGSIDPLRDTRLLTVARRALDFKHLPAIAVRVDKDTFVFEPGAPARALVGGHNYKTDSPVDSAQLREIEDQGGAWADLLGVRPLRREAA
jgi:hypothetical protein